MQSGLGHRIVWYMVMNVLEEHSGSVFTVHLKMEAVCCDRKHWYQLITQSYNPEDYSFEFSVHYISVYYKPNKYTY